MGKAGMVLGATLGKKSQEEEDRTAAYEAEKRILQFTKEQARRLDDEQRSMPQGGTGFTDSFGRSYDTAARDLFANAQREGLSPRALQRLDIGLLRGGEALHTRANAYENAERQRLGEFELEEALATARGNVRADPDLLSNERERGRILIEGAPHIASAHRYTIMRRFNRLIEEEALGAMRQRVRTPEDLRRFNEWAAAHARTSSGATRRGPTPDAFQPGGGAPREGAAPPAAAPGGVRPPGGEPPGPAGASRPGPGGELQRTIRRVRGVNDRGARPAAPTHIVLHHTGGTTVESAEAAHGRTGFAYHDYILPDGSVERRHEHGRVVHHAGTIDRARTGATNENAIGIAFVAPDEGAITAAQRETARWLIPQVAAENGIPASNIWGHREEAAVNPLTARRSEGEGVMAREFREGRIPMDVAAAPGPRSAGPRGVGAPQAPAATLQDRSADAGYAPDPAATGTALSRPMYAGSPEWFDAVINEAERGAVARTNLPNVAATRLRSEARGAAVQVRQTRNEIITAIRAWENGALEGNSPSEAEIAQAREMVEAFNDGSEEGLQVAEYFHSIVGYPDGRQGLIQRVSNLRRLHPVQLEKEVLNERLRQRTRSTEADRRLLTHMETLLKRSQTQINEDANGWMAVAGHSPAPEELDYRNEESMQRRAALARHNGERLNRPPMFFSPNERDAIRDRWRRGDEETVPMLESIARNFGIAGINEMLQRSEDGSFRDPEIAGVAAIAVNARRNNNVGMQLAHDLAAEIRQRNTDASYNATAQRYRPAPADLRSAQEFIGRTLEALPSLESAATAATNALYLRWARTNAVITFDDRKYREIFISVLGRNNGDPKTSTAQNVYGGLYYQSGRSGNPIPVPSNIRNDDRVAGIAVILGVLQPEDLRTLQAIDGGTLGPVGATGRELMVRDITQGRLVAIGGGRYVVDAANNPNAPAWAIAPPGAPTPGPNDNRFILDLNALEPVIRERVPEVYRDYRFGEAGRFRPRGFNVTVNEAGRVVPRLRFGPDATLGPEHPDYPKGQFAPRVNPGRGITQPEWVEFHRQFRERHPSRYERDKIMASQSRYWKELQQYIDGLPPRLGASSQPTPPASPAP